MKKLFLLVMGGCVALGANAQYMKHTATNTQNNSRIPFVGAPAQKATKARYPHAAARTTASALTATETFAGSPGILPSGWTAGSSASPAGNWKWTAAASTSPFTMGAMHSTSASDGWMIFDSDSLGVAFGSSYAPTGWLQSPGITIPATATSVRLNFENYYRSFNDSCSVWVSTNSAFPAGSYAVYPVIANNALATNTSSANTSMIHINISPSAAAGATVYIRFVYYGAAGGSYSWMIDDMNLTEMDPVDVATEKGSTVYYSGSDVGFNAFGTKPLKMMDTVIPVAYLSNLGSLAQTPSVNAKIFQGTSSVYDQSVTVTLPVNAIDTIADFSGFTGYLATATGGYKVPFAASTTATDADLTNNADTTTFGVTDTSWSENVYNAGFTAPLTEGGYYVHRTTAPVASFSMGTSFAVTRGRMDTLTSVSVAFDNTTTAGQKVAVQIYHFDAASTSWQYDGLTKSKTLTSTDISTASTIKYTTFMVDYDASSAYIVLNGGTGGVTYAAVVKGENNTGDVVILSGPNPANADLIGSVGVSDTSLNDGAASQQFGSGGLPSGLESVPFVNLNFGKVPSLGVNDIDVATGTVGKAYPNPANTSVTVPFTIAQNNEVTVTLTNILGQVVRTQRVNAIAGQSHRATFATSDLTNGIYLYTVSVNGQQTTGRVTVAH